MKITYTARKVNLRDNFKERAEKKLLKFEKLFSEDAAVNVVVTLEKNRQTVEITIRDNGMVYRAESTMEEMNDALDRVVDILMRQIRKNKTRLEKRIKYRSEKFQEIHTYPFYIAFTAFSRVKVILHAEREKYNLLPWRLPQWLLAIGCHQTRPLNRHRNAFAFVGKQNLLLRLVSGSVVHGYLLGYGQLVQSQHRSLFLKAGGFAQK